jgi:uncharacterized membrane protein YebE (DUF533 family)
MFDAERLLTNLVRDTVMDQVGFGGRRGRKKRRKGKKGKGLARALGGSGMTLGKGAALGVGALGLAAAAYGFMAKKGAQGAAAEAQSPSSRPQGGPPATPPAAPMASPPPPPPPITKPIPEAPRFTQDEALLLVKAMIAAAAADGEIDADERAHVLGELEACSPSDEDRAQVSAWLDRPPAMHEIAMAASDPKLAEQVYAVSCLAIEVDTAQERGYLQVLARSLGLPAERVQEINSQLGIDEA